MVNKLHRIVYLILLGMFPVINAQAQQQAMTTQYMFNGLAINPAYAGSHETLSLTAHLRSQWTGFDGAPNTQSFSAHGPLRKDKIALGFMVLHDKIGVTSVTSLTPSYAYRIHFDNKSILSLGLQFILSNYIGGFSDLNPTDPNDIAFSQDINRWIPNFGTGVYYYTDKFYVGGSIPLLLNSDVSADGNVTDEKAVLKAHYYVTGGYVFSVGNDIILKPNMMIRGVKGSPIIVDMNVNAYFLETIGTGLSYRFNESFSLILEFLITDELRLGYSYDYVLNNLKAATNGSHEIMVNYRFPFSKNRVVSPRYF